MTGPGMSTLTMTVAQVASGTVGQPSDSAARAGTPGMTSLTTSRGSLVVTWCTGPTTVIDVVVSFSAHDWPTQSSTSPGSTMRTMARSENASRVVGTWNRTTTDSPGSSATRR